MTNEGTPPPITRAQILGVTLGNALEFYDFLVFSFFAVQIGQCFFPATNPHSSLLLALATFGAGFLTRPIGAFVIGGLGDRIGRRPMMLLSFAMIGLSTLGVAITPSYAAIGVAAPVLVIAVPPRPGLRAGRRSRSELRVPGRSSARGETRTLHLAAIRRARCIDPARGRDRRVACRHDERCGAGQLGLAYRDGRWGGDRAGRAGATPYAARNATPRRVGDDTAAVQKLCKRRDLRRSSPCCRRRSRPMCSTI